eukprot:CAMPEP_0171179260 /NCGR_PEP_ID=MMETSP0790-20130122/13166_1 /TAXON_ID=2925 /ORGANISM="Alexandrium catenella, Strain OF101" /LENGTH=671 /DNA_ID=CAMNT_0011644189 /DNA_START=43 /DNA_END=2058 /DNA_ORIENTATION=-
MPLTFNFGEENRPELWAGKPKTPVTLLSGFLGTGKTTLLKHLLENQDGVRIGVVVNDVAAVNIDSQLVRRYDKGLVEVAELQNGCVCCSSADDLFSAVQNIVMRSKDHAFEHIVVELSGVGEPEAVKRNWAVALECSMPVALRTEVKQVVTVVDASAFGRDWLDTRQAQERNEEVRGEQHDEKNKARLENVGQLLAEQVEWADVVVVNKTDLASDEELQTTLEVIRALNARAPAHHATFGKVPPQQLLPAVPRGLKIAQSGEGEGYSWSQTPAEVTVRMAVEPGVKGRDVDFKVGRQTLCLGVKNRAKPRAEGRLSGRLKNTDDVVWEIDGSGPERSVCVTLEKRSSGMWPGLWHASESAAPAPEERASCPADCSDPSHGHGHGHGHGEAEGHGHHAHGGGPSAASSAERRFGIHSFAFQRRRPFSAERLEALLRAWPTPRKELFTLEELSLPADRTAASGAGELDSALRPVLRSKGFCWLDSEPLRRHVWAHAGKTMAVRPADWWWAALDTEQLGFKVSYPGVEADYKLARREKWDAEVGDRRQELVFIGGPLMSAEAIVALLERCLLSDEEFEAFRERTKALKVPNDEFHVNGLLKNLGASQEQIRELDQKADRGRERERSSRRQDREDTDLLRSLGVGSALEPEDEATSAPGGGTAPAAPPEAFESID